MDETYTCSISGNEAAEEAIVDNADESDELGGLPVGWAEITVRIREANPERVKIDRTKAALVDQQLQQVPAANREDARETVEILVNAQFAMLESQTPRYITDEQTVHVAAEHVKTALGALGVSGEDE